MSPDSTQIAVRQATEADIPGIVSVVNVAFRHEHAFLASERTSDVEIRQLMEKSTFLVRSKYDQIIGAVHVETEGKEQFDFVRMTKTL